MPFVKSHFSVSLDELLPPSTAEKTTKFSGFRPVCLKSGVFPGQRGSAYVEFGNTRVLAQTAGPKESNEADYHSGAVTVNVSGYEDEKLRAQLVSALSSCIQLRKYSRSLITCEVTVMNADGGILQAALLATSLAIMHAGIEVFDIILPAHVSVSPSGQITVDPSSNQEENVHGEVTVAVMPNLNQIVCCEVRGQLPLGRINEAISTAHRTCLHLYPAVKKAVVDSLAS